MKYTFPHTIENSHGEKIIFKSIELTAGGEKLWVESFCAPGSGPIMHTHFKQEEALTVISGTMAYQVRGQQPKYAWAGETVIFQRGTPHKFWAVGNENLHMKGWIQPANSIVFFLSSVFAAQAKSGKGEPESFDGAYLLTKYASEYDMAEIPWLVKKVILPLTCLAGRLLGKYQHFKDAPAPMK
jgi:quercetin dioxygenase-like cupin family protein